MTMNEEKTAFADDVIKRTNDHFIKESIALQIQYAKGVTINNLTDYENAVAMIQEIKKLRKRLDKRYMPIRDKTFDAYKLARQNVNDYEKPLSEAEKIIRSSMGKYSMKKEQERRVEENRLHKEAEKKEQLKIKKELAECGLNKKEAAEESKKIDVIVPIVQIKDTTKTNNVT